MCSNLHSIEDSWYDQDTYWGRVKYIFRIHNPFPLLTSSATLQDAQCLYLKYKCGEPIPDVDDEELRKARVLYESAFNTKTGEKLSVMTRPGMQVTNDMVLAGGLMAFNPYVIGVVVWHSLNQIYNTFVNCARRSEDTDFTDKQVATAYILATGTAIGTALGLNHLLKATPNWMRFVPLAAVTTAHCVSVPLLKAQMLKNGTAIYDDGGNKLGYSKMAAQKGINAAIAEKVAWALPPFIITPLLIKKLEWRGTFCRYPWLSFPAHAAIAGLCLGFISPFTCALLNQKVSLAYAELEPELREHMCKKYYDRPPRYIYFDRNL